MNTLTELLKAINKFRGRKFLVVVILWYLVYQNKIDQYWAAYCTMAYFIVDLIEKYITNMNEEDL